MQPVTEIARTAGIDEKYIEQYGRYKASGPSIYSSMTTRAPL